SVVTVTESTGSRSKTTLGSKSCNTWGSGWRRWAVGLSSVHMPITLLEDQKPQRIATFWREPTSGTDADNSPGRTVARVGDPGADAARQRLAAASPDSAGYPRPGLSVASPTAVRAPAACSGVAGCGG